MMSSGRQDEENIALITASLLAVEQATLVRVEKAGCAHFCSPPCPFNRKMADFKAVYEGNV
jgi:hypothetical protein